MSALLWWCDFTYTICRVTLPTERVSWNKCHKYFSSEIHWSRSPRSVWVEIYIGGKIRRYCFCHAPHGACELKYTMTSALLYFWFVTLPTERVSWNRRNMLECHYNHTSRSPRSVWVEISYQADFSAWYIGHAPHGACELKFLIGGTKPPILLSRSPRSVWVEILFSTVLYSLYTSRSPRSVWVEICYVFVKKKLHFVTLPTERVSWNHLQRICVVVQ